MEAEQNNSFKGYCLPFKENYVKPHDYRVEVSKEDIEKQIKKVKKEKIKFVFDIIIAITVFPALSGLVGCFLPLPFSFVSSLIIGVWSYVWFTNRNP